jgi:hypothetical protein
MNIATERSELTMAKEERQREKEDLASLKVNLQENEGILAERQK